MTRRAGGRSRVAAAGLALVLTAGLAACSASHGDSGHPSQTISPRSGPSGSSRSSSTGAPVHLTLAFAGDVHFAGSSAVALTQGIGPGAAPLAAADLAVVNLETAITDGGSAASKQFSFRAPPQSLQVLKSAGIDVANVANNHGMDYGLTGLQDTLAASKTYHLPLIGAGEDATQAFAGYRRTIRGVRVSVVSATDVLDSSLQAAWTAGPDKPGLASAKDGDLLVQRIAAVRQSSDVVVAFLHWGVELQVCPTQRQQQLAQELVDAGADVVVGSHAHVLQPLTTIGHVPVDYGMGNFVFYAHRGVDQRSGVLQVSVTAVPGAGAAGHPSATAHWIPEHIVSGRPVLTSSGPALPSMADCR